MFLQPKASRFLLVVILSFCGISSLHAQVQPQPSDTSARTATTATDTVTTAAADTTTHTTDTVPAKRSMLEATVNYQAADSIVMTGDNLAFLYGESNVKYQQIQLQSEQIRIHMDSSAVLATYGTDTTGTEFGYPLFIENEQQIEARIMQYNFKTRKAYARDVLTQQGEGFLNARLTKKMPDDAMNMLDGRYTTCDNHDCPHFYIQMTRAKARPGKNIVAGPAYMVFEEVPIYLLGVPFAFFPFTDSYSSGIIMPTFGDDMNQGFYLREGGYYFAINDYVDLALRGDIYSKGTWGVSARSTYRKRYKWSGGFDISYQKLVTGIKQVDRTAATSFSVNWSHTQDAKANPYLTLSASVNFSMNQHDQNLVRNAGLARKTENAKGSSVSISKRFPNSPFTLSATMSLNQRTADSTVSITLPNLMISMSTIYPLKRKNAVGSDRWYEKLSLSYSGTLQNSISTKENRLFQSNLVRDWRNGMRHSIPISATYSFGSLNLSPSFNYTERWYTSKVEKQLQRHESGGVEPSYHLVPTDTTYGFYRVYDFNASISASTTLYGEYVPWKMWGGFVQKIRHRVTPSVSFAFAPDFGDSRYGYYRTAQVYDASTEQYLHSIYSPFEGQMFGVPGRGRQGSVSFSLDNNLEAKIRSNSDSTGIRKISLIDRLNLNMSYNMAADSFRWSDLSVSVNLRWFKGAALSLSGIFDTYTYRYDETLQRPVKQDIMRWQAGKGIGRLKSTGWSYSYTIDNNTFKNLFGKKDNNRSDNRNSNDDDDDENDDTTTDQPSTGKRLRGAKKEDTGEYDADGYYRASVPWSVSFFYSMGLGYDGQKFNRRTNEYAYELRHALSFDANIQPTKNWRISMRATYDVDNRRISHLDCNISRNLHCFQMTASFRPIGHDKSYSFSISVNSSLLKDLKYDQHSGFRAGQSWY